MIAKTYILENLRLLERSYNGAKTQKKALFFSKLAVLELCGWVEESMDDLVLRCSRRVLKDPQNRKYVKTNIVERTYGFDYEKHFRFMLIRLVGLTNVEKIEKAADQTKRAKFVATLAALKKIRNQEAHTHIKGTTRQINSPSVTITQFQPIYDGLMDIERVLKQKKL